MGGGAHRVRGPRARGLHSVWHCGAVSDPLLWVPDMLLWCLEASRGWKLEWTLTPTCRWLNPVSSLICTSTPVPVRAAALSARR